MRSGHCLFCIAPPRDIPPRRIFSFFLIFWLHGGKFTNAQMQIHMRRRRRAYLLMKVGRAPDEYLIFQHGGQSGHAPYHSRRRPQQNHSADLNGQTNRN